MRVGVYDQPALPDNARTQVFITTLGEFEITVDGAAATLTGGGAGANQLRRGYACLVAYVDEQVSKTKLMEVSGGTNDGYRPYVPRGLSVLARQWGMGGALIARKDTMELRRHPSWQSDVDRLKALVHIAEVERQHGSIDQAIACMEQAASLCRGDYLSIFDNDRDLALGGDVTYWKAAQLNVFRLLARWRLSLDGREQAEMAYAAGTRALRYDPLNAEVLQLLADAARRLDNEASAQYYEQRARAARHSPAGST